MKLHQCDDARGQCAFLLLLFGSEITGYIIGPWSETGTIVEWYAQNHHWGFLLVLLRILPLRWQEIMRGPRRSREDATPSWSGHFRCKCGQINCSGVNAGKKNIWTAFNFVLWDPDNTRTHASDGMTAGTIVLPYLLLVLVLLSFRSVLVQNSLVVLDLSNQKKSTFPTIPSCNLYWFKRCGRRLKTKTHFFVLQSEMKNSCEVQHHSVVRAWMFCIPGTDSSHAWCCTTHEYLPERIYADCPKSQLVSWIDLRSVCSQSKIRKFTSNFTRRPR